jgi:hypothetical protein
VRGAGCALVAFALAAAAGTCALRLRPPHLAVPPAGVELDHVTVVVPGRGRSAGQTLVARDGVIARLSPTPPGAPPGPFAGTFVLPGLVDLHVHHPPPLLVGERELFALLFLLHGVTTVRDVGGPLPQGLARHARAVAQGARAGPRVLRCGPFLDGAPPVWPGARVVRDAAEGRAAVRELAAAGVDCVKLYNELGPEATAGILEAAREAEIPVVGHLPWALDVGSLPGVEVQHLMGFADVWENAAPEALAHYVEASRAARLRHTPTLVAFARARAIGDPRAIAADPAGALLPRHYRELLWNVERNALARELATDERRLHLMLEAVAALHAADVPVLAGTDAPNPLVVPGAALHEELHWLAQAGLGPEGAWRAATERAADALGRPRLGRIEAGAPADLLVFRADPSRDLGALATLEAVVAEGRLYRVSELRAAVERALAHFASWPYGPLSRAGVSLALAAFFSSEAERTPAPASPAPAPPSPAPASPARSPGGEG